MKNSKFKIQNLQFIFCVLLLAFCGFAAYAQSTNQDFPTPVTKNEISGRIAARDVGDSRLTSYYYAFEGTSGDVFINVEAANFNGDIDVFTAGNLRPLTKITLYAGEGATETGRVVYLRKPEKLLLRVQGRTPNDDPATFRVKFAGSFVALQTSESEEPKLPEIKTNENAEIRVNSVGTIVEIRPKPASKQTTTAAAAGVEKTKPPETAAEIKTKAVAEENEKDPEDREKNAPKVVVTGETAKAEEPKERKPAAARRAPRRARAKPPAAKTEAEIGANQPPTEAETVRTSPPKNSAAKKSPVKTAKPKETAPNPLENVRLLILFKDGTKIERPMSEVSRVNVDNKGMLTIVAKDGAITRHSILDVAKMTIE